MSLDLSTISNKRFTEPLAFSVTPDQKAWLEDTCDASGIKLAQLVRALIDQARAELAAGDLR